MQNTFYPTKWGMHIICYVTLVDISWHLMVMFIKFGTVIKMLNEHQLLDDHMVRSAGKTTRKLW